MAKPGPRAISGRVLFAVAIRLPQHRHPLDLRILSHFQPAEIDAAIDGHEIQACVRMATLLGGGQASHPYVKREARRREPRYNSMHTTVRDSIGASPPFMDPPPWRHLPGVESATPGFGPWIFLLHVGKYAAILPTCMKDIWAP